MRVGVPRDHDVLDAALPAGIGCIAYERLPRLTGAVTHAGLATDSGLPRFGA